MLRAVLFEKGQALAVSVRSFKVGAVALPAPDDRQALGPPPPGGGSASAATGGAVWGTAGGIAGAGGGAGAVAPGAAEGPTAAAAVSPHLFSTPLVFQHRHRDPTA